MSEAADAPTRSLSAWLAWAARELSACSSSARLDAEVMLAHVLGLGRSALYARGDDPLPAPAAAGAHALLARRKRGEPIAYLTGRREFWSLELEVGPGVLIPRPDTETLVEVALGRLAAQRRPRVLDLGTGSGAIALAIARERADAEVVAVECSPAALALARANGARLGLLVDWREGDWFAPVAGQTFDAVLCNPPYIARADPELEPAVRAFEPALALFSGAGGMADLARIIRAAPAHLAPGGVLVIEHGARQGASVRDLCTGAGLVHVDTHLDTAGHERVTSARWGGVP